MCRRRFETASRARSNRRFDEPQPSPAPPTCAAKAAAKAKFRSSACRGRTLSRWERERQTIRTCVMADAKLDPGFRRDDELRDGELLVATDGYKRKVRVAPVAVSMVQPAPQANSTRDAPAMLLQRAWRGES